MATFIPRRDETLEADPHQKWLEKAVVDHEKRIAALEAALDKLLKANGTSGKQVAVINARDTTTGTSGDGLPPGGITGQVVRHRGRSVGSRATWTHEFQGFMPAYEVSLDPTDGSSYTVTAMVNLEGDAAAVAEMTKALLPTVLFDDGGNTLLSIDHANYVDSYGNPPTTTGQAPIHLTVYVYPTFEGEPFGIHLPRTNNFYASTSPFYTFSLANYTEFTAAVSIYDADLYYDGTTTPVNGDTDLWSIAPDYEASWFVRAVRGQGAIATPITTSAGVIRDPYFSGSVSAARNVVPIFTDGTLTTFTGTRRLVNNTGTDQTISSVTADVGTAPTGSAITLVVKKNGSPISSSFSIAAGTTAGVAVLTDTAYAAGDAITVDVTGVGSTVAGADLTVQVYFG